jgi:hypothetical protein
MNTLTFATFAEAERHAYIAGLPLPAWMEEADDFQTGYRSLVDEAENRAIYTGEDLIKALDDAKAEGMGFDSAARIEELEGELEAAHEALRRLRVDISAERRTIAAALEAGGSCAKADGRKRLAADLRRRY